MPCTLEINIKCSGLGKETLRVSLFILPPTDKSLFQKPLRECEKWSGMKLNKETTSKFILKYGKNWFVFGLMYELV